MRAKGCIKLLTVKIIQKFVRLMPTMNHNHTLLLHAMTSRCSFLIQQRRMDYAKSPFVFLNDLLGITTLFFFMP